MENYGYRTDVLILLRVQAQLIGNFKNMPKVFVSIFSVGAQANTDYQIPIPEEISSNGYMLVGLMVSNNPNGSSVPMHSFYDINYVGQLKTNGIYSITNPLVLNNTARAIWVYW